MKKVISVICLTLLLCISIFSASACDKTNEGDAEINANGSIIGGTVPNGATNNNSTNGTTNNNSANGAANLPSKEPTPTFVNADGVLTTANFAKLTNNLIPTAVTLYRGYPTAKSGDIYLAPNGNDSNSGSSDSPLYSIAAAVTKAKPGTTIFMKTGQYNYSSTINISTSGTEENPIYIQAENWKEVVIDFKGIPYGKNTCGWGIVLSGNYWHIQGLTLQYAGDNAIKVEGSYNYIGRCITHHNGDTGIQLGFGHHTNVNNPGHLCAYNTIENCDSYNNLDFDNGGDADGFACKMHNGKNNLFIGCRSWYNSDDAWDLYETNYAVYIINCWAWGSGSLANMQDFDQGYLAKTKAIASNCIELKNGKYTIKKVGNGNGIKLGGNGEGGNSKGTHIVYNCVAFNNYLSSSVKGFDENSHSDGEIIVNCVGFDNGYNFMLDNGGSSKNRLENNIAFNTGLSNNAPVNKSAGEMKAGLCTNCNFVYDGTKNLSIPTGVTASDFITISVDAAKAQRQTNGALPNNGFAKFKNTSANYSKGMGLVY